MENIYNLYKSVLKFAGYRVTDDGYVQFAVSQTKAKPLHINDKAVVMPYPEHLNNPSGKIIFHPLCENIMRGESDIIKKLNAGINIRFNMVLALLVPKLLNIVASPIEHSKLTPDQLDLLTTVKEADDNCVKNIGRIVREEIVKKPTSYFISLFLKRGGVYQEKKYSRVGIVRFPFYESLDAMDLKYVRVKDKEAYRQVFDYIFPQINDPEVFNYGTNDRTAPFFVALMNTAANVAARLNDIIDLYSDFLEEQADEIRFDADWLDQINDLNQLQKEIRMIPPQAGNEGSISIKEQNSQQHEVMPALALEKPTPIPEPKPAPTPTPTQMNTGLPMPAPVQPKAEQEQKRGVSINELMQRTHTHPQYGPNPLQAQIASEQWQRMNEECLRTFGYPVPNGFVFDLNTKNLVPVAPQQAYATPMGYPPPPMYPGQPPMGYPPQQAMYPGQVPMQPPRRPSAGPGTAMTPPAPWNQPQQPMMPAPVYHQAQPAYYQAPPQGYPPQPGYPSAPMGYPMPGNPYSNR